MSFAALHEKIDALQAGMDALNAKLDVLLAKVEEGLVLAKLAECLEHFAHRDPVELPETEHGEVYQLPCGTVMFRAFGENGFGQGEVEGDRDASGGIALDIDAEKANEGSHHEGGLLVTRATDAQGLVEELGEADDAGHAVA